MLEQSALMFCWIYWGGVEIKLDFVVFTVRQYI